MKRFLLALLLACPLVSFAQSAIQRNAATTNSPARVQNVLLTTPSTNLYPVLVQKPDGTGGDRILQYAPSFFMSNGIGHFTNSIPIRFPGLSSNTLLRIDAGFGLNNVIGGVSNTMTKWTGTGTIGNSSLTDDGTNLSYNGSGTVSAQNGAFTNSLTLNGSPVLTNAPGSGITNSGTGTPNVVAVWTDTNSLGDSIITSDSTNVMVGIGNSSGPSFVDATDIFYVGANALKNSSLSSSSFSIYALGDSALFNASLDVCGFVYAQGSSAMSGIIATNVDDLYGIGNDLLDGALITDSSQVYAFGEIAMYAATITNNSRGIYGFGEDAMDSVIIDQSSDIFANGPAAMLGANIINSTYISGYDRNALRGAVLDSDDDMHAFGNGALASATLTNSSDIYAFGTSAGDSLTGGTLSHIFILGSGGTATNSNDFVFGDSAYNYFFPGASASFANYISISGKTNRYTDNGTTLLRDGVAIGGGGTQVWTNDGGIYPVSPIVLVRPRTDNAENLGTNGLRWLNIWSYGLDVDGDIRVSGNISPRDVPYIWPVTQGDTNTILVNDGTGVLSWEPRTNAPVSGVTENVTTLGWSGTNITGFNCATNFQGYYLLATNNAHFGSSTFSNLPTKTQLRNFTLCIQQDSTGGRIISFTNSIVGWSLGPTNAPFIETNSGSVSYVYFHSSLATNNMLVATFNMDVR